MNKKSQTGLRQKTQIQQSLTDKLHPARFTAMSEKMAAIVGFIVGKVYTAPPIVELSVTSDGFVLACNRGDCGANYILGSLKDFRSNWERLLNVADLTDEEQKLAEFLYAKAVRPTILAAPPPAT